MNIVITAEIAYAQGFATGMAYARDESDVDTAPAEWTPLFQRRWQRGFDDACDQLGEVEEVTNLMTGKSVVQSVDTPWCCNVSSEAYWSM